MKSLQESKIPDLDTFKKRMPGSVLVALDIESFHQGISEVGIAILDQTPSFSPGLRDFHEQNGVEVVTFQVRERIFHTRRRFPEQARYGTTILSGINEVRSLVQKKLSEYEGDLILVGFDPTTEFAWISQEQDSLSSSFQAWIDVQELAGKNCGKRIGLTSALRAMGIKDWRANSSRHYAANDALRCLAVLSGLLHGISAQPTTALSINSEPGLHLFCSIPKPSSKHLFTVRITSCDGNKLPSEYQSPVKLAKQFREYELQGAGVNCQKEYSRLNGVKIWWLSFHKEESLEQFVSEIHGSTLNGTKLHVLRNNRQDGKYRQTDIDSGSHSMLL